MPCIKIYAVLLPHQHRVAAKAWPRLAREDSSVSQDLQTSGDLPRKDDAGTPALGTVCRRDSSVRSALTLMASMLRVGCSKAELTRERKLECGRFESTCCFPANILTARPVSPTIHVFVLVHDRQALGKISRSRGDAPLFKFPTGG